MVNVYVNLKGANQKTEAMAIASNMEVVKAAKWPIVKRKHVVRAYVRSIIVLVGTLLEMFLERTVLIFLCD